MERRLKGESLESRICLASGVAPTTALGPLGSETEAPSAIVSATSSSTGAESVDSLSDLTDRVSFAGEGFGTLQISPTGDLGQLYYIDQDLHYRSRSATGSFVDQFVTEVDAYTFSTFARGIPAQLLYRSDGSSIVLVAQEDGFLAYQPDGLGAWAQTDSVSYDPIDPFDVTGHLLAEVGPDDSIHVVITAGDFYFGRMLYATNQSGSWAVTEIADPAAAGSYNHFYALHSRYVSMAVADDGSVHIAYTPEFLDFGQGGYRRPFDQLAYLSNRSGSWVTEIVHQPNDDSGQSGLASSIAIAADGQPAIASFFVDRYPTGSAVSSQLMFHQRGSNGSWSGQVVVDRPDGYVAGDGPKFTGFAPHLVFDDLGRANIAFSDHASQHFPNYGADEFAGQIRHAVKGTSGWSINTVFAQHDPLRATMAFPTLAILPNEIIFVGIQELVELDENLIFIGAASNYIESIIPQTGLTLTVADRNVSTAEPVNLVIERHHGDLLTDTTVLVQSSDPQTIAAQQIVIPAGRHQVLATLEIAPGTLLDENQIITLTASADGYYPGSTIVIAEPIDLQWHNDLMAHDVNNDAQISPLDALVVINWIAVASTGGNPQSATDPRFPDVDANGTVSPRDALLVLNYLANTSNAPGNAPESEGRSSEQQTPRSLLFWGIDSAHDSGDDWDDQDWVLMFAMDQTAGLAPTS